MTGEECGRELTEVTYEWRTIMDYSRNIIGGVDTFDKLKTRRRVECAAVRIRNGFPCELDIVGSKGFPI